MVLHRGLVSRSSTAVNSPDLNLGAVIAMQALIRAGITSLGIPVLAGILSHMRPPMDGDIGGSSLTVFRALLRHIWAKGTQI
ncbi:hypothetical protein Tco_0875491 [Tanacetum coccineum]|uniref:Uncharacterized protein n=1 Tax=Tanacetum coccineum TaxID=301880 RepID=A0ABQ5BPQ1_9ASTR